MKTNIDWHEKNIMTSSDKKDWQTPPDLFEYLDRKYQFSLDPCAKKGFELCDINYYEEDDGLSKDWRGESVFINPPYGRAELNTWFDKILQEHVENLTRMVVLVPARVDRVLFHEIILPKASHIYFIKGRLKFYTGNEEHKDPAPFPSMIVVFDFWHPTAYKMRSLYKDKSTKKWEVDKY